MIHYHFIKVMGGLASYVYHYISNIFQFYAKDPPELQRPKV